jgi:hypothetical protein
MEKGASLESRNNVRDACCVIQSPLLISLRLEILLSISLASMAILRWSPCSWREEGASIWRVTIKFVSSLSSSPVSSHLWIGRGDSRAAAGHRMGGRSGEEV